MATVLIVDDEESIRFVFKEYLRADGYEVETAETVEQALRFLAQQAFDVVVSDILLAAGSGLDVLHYCMDKLPRVPVIMMTGDPNLDVAADLVRSHAFDYLIKPIMAEALCQSVARAVRVKNLDDQRERLEQENQRYREHLKQLVDEQTLELRATNEQLAAAMEELKKTQAEMLEQERLRALGQLASGIAHEFNNSLSVILGYTELMLSLPQKLEDREETLRYLELIHTAAKDATVIVTRMREFYRPQEKNTPRQWVRLDDMVKQSISLTMPKWKEQAQNRGVTIEVCKELEKVPPIRGKEAELRELLTNLILNAIDAMQQDGRVVIRTRRQGHFVTLEVEDNGIGMDEETRKKCLQPFFTTKGEEGTGLGLPQVCTLVRRYNGEIGVESQKGKGSCFRISFPISEECSRDDQTSSKKASPLPRLKILLVEDELAVLDVLTDRLRADKHEVMAIQDGRKALALVKQESFDLVITDRAMPYMNGDSVAREVKQYCPDLPVIMVTGIGSIMKARKDIPPYVDKVLGKPVSQEKLRETMAQLIRKAREEKSVTRLG